MFINNINELNTLLYGAEKDGLQNLENAVLVKVKIENILYNEWQQTTSWSFINWWSSIQKWKINVNLFSGFKEKISGVMRKYAH